jgi:hypothetical protein
MSIIRFGMAVAIGAGVILSGLTGTARAQQQAAAQAPAATEIKRVKMRTLLTDGYEIKSVTLVPQEIASRIAQRPDVDAALITLQKGSQGATCFLSFAQFILPGMLDIEWCIEQK